MEWLGCIGGTRREERKYILVAIENLLGRAFQNIFLDGGTHSDLNKVVFRFRRTVDFTPDTFPWKVEYLINLFNALHTRFERFYGFADVEKIISTLQRALALTHSGHPLRPILLRDLGVYLNHRFKHRGDVTDLHNAIVTV